MGWQATGWAFKAPITNPGCKFVLVALAERAGNENDDHRSWYCHPSIKTIGDYTAQGNRTIQRHLDWLEDNGFLNRERRVIGAGKLGAYNFTLNPHGCQNGQWPNGAPETAPNGQTEPVIGTSQDIIVADAPEPFEAWWATYPRKMAKVAARKAWKAVPAKIGLEDLLALTRRFAEHVVGKDPEHIAHPATWLNGERWTDELPSTNGSQTDGRRDPQPTRADRAIAERVATFQPMALGAQAALDRRRGRKWSL